jgi:hypothetical protein
MDVKYIPGLHPSKCSCFNLAGNLSIARLVTCDVQHKTAAYLLTPAPVYFCEDFGGMFAEGRNAADD